MHRFACTYMYSAQQILYQFGIGFASSSLVPSSIPNFVDRISTISKDTSSGTSGFPHINPHHFIQNLQSIFHVLSLKSNLILDSFDFSDQSELSKNEQHSSGLKQKFHKVSNTLRYEKMLMKSVTDFTPL